MFPDCFAARSPPAPAAETDDPPLPTINNTEDVVRFFREEIGRAADRVIAEVRAVHNEQLRTGIARTFAEALQTG